MLNFKLSRTVLCISILGTNGHRTAKRVKNTGTSQSTGICGHTGRTTPAGHMRLFTIGWIAVLVGRAGSEAARRAPRPHLHFASFKKSWYTRKLTADAPIHVYAVCGFANRGRRLRGDCRVLPPPLPLMYSYCEPLRALSDREESFHGNCGLGDIAIKLYGE